jgi:Cytochrome bd terminal oxidase subunit I
VPLLGSLILTHHLDGTVRGLKEWPAADRRPVAIPFFGFRIMVGIGLLMLALVVASWLLRRQDRLFDAEVVLVVVRTRGSAWLSGQCWPAGQPPRSNANPLDQLTVREIDILRLRGEGTKVHADRGCAGRIIQDHRQFLERDQRETRC